MSSRPRWPLTPLDHHSRAPGYTWAWHLLGLSKGSLTCSIGDHEVWVTKSTWPSLALGIFSQSSGFTEPLTPRPGLGGSPRSPALLGIECPAAVPP